MPVVTLPSAGDTATASAESGQKYVFEFVPGSVGSNWAGGAVAWIECDGLPEVFVYVRQILNEAGGGLLGCTFTPVFAVSVDRGPEAEWLPLTAPQAIPFGAPSVPIYFRDRLPGVSVVGLWIDTPVGATPADNCRFEVVLGASQ